MEDLELTEYSGVNPWRGGGGGETKDESLTRTDLDLVGAPNIDDLIVASGLNGNSYEAWVEYSTSTRTDMVLEH